MKTAISTKKNKENKTEIITLRVTEQQKQEIERKGAEMGLGISACLSHVLADYGNLKKESQQANAKMIEVVTQKEIMEQALLKTQQDSKTLDNPAFTECFESVVGQELNGKLSTSKYDLLGVLATRADITRVEDNLEVEIPLEAKNSVLEKEVQGYPVWQIALAALVVCAVVATIIYAQRTRSR
jgi:hypothetical protein